METKYINVTKLSCHDTRLSRKSIYKALGPLLDYGLVIESRTIANTTLYKLNTDSKAVHFIDKFNNELIRVISDRECTQENPLEVKGKDAIAAIKSR